MTRQAFVLGAGLGTRLKTLTQKRPKPLIPIVNRPLIEHAFDHLIGAGVERLVINTHWRAEAYAAAFPKGAYAGMALTFRNESPLILETAGGIKNVEDLLRGERFWVYNGDILSTLPLESAEQVHVQSGNEVTLVLRSNGGPLQIGFDPDSGRVTDIGGRIRSDDRPRFLFTGIYLVEPSFLARVPPAIPISVVPIFCEMIRAGAPLGAVVSTKANGGTSAPASKSWRFMPRSGIRQIVIRRAGFIREPRFIVTPSCSAPTPLAPGLELEPAHGCRIPWCGMELTWPQARSSNAASSPRERARKVRSATPT